MKVSFRESFLKDIQNCKDTKVREAVANVITQVENAKLPQDIVSMKKLKGFKTAYRIRVKDYRIGLVLETGTIEFVRLLNRKEIYRYFP